jgi:HlyD family secretion protein
MKRKTIILIIAAIALLAIVYLVFGRSKVTAGDIKIETARVEKGTISKLVESTGTLQALDTVQVGTQVSGIVIKFMSISTLR